MSGLMSGEGKRSVAAWPKPPRPSSTLLKAQKNDDRDAEGIAEAATRPTMRFVEVKTEAQLDMQTLHRSRDRLVGERTALINQLRAILLERGIVVPRGKRKLEHYLVTLMEEREGGTLTARMRMLVADMPGEFHHRRSHASVAVLADPLLALAAAA